MIFLNNFVFPEKNRETDFIWSIKETCHTSFYPFRTLSSRGFERIDFETVTILHGGNGTGKSTVLNVIAEKSHIIRSSMFNRSCFFQDYVNMCKTTIEENIPPQSRIITSDDVFDYMLNLRAINEGIDQKREELYSEYSTSNRTPFTLKSMDDYEQLTRVYNARRKTKSQFVRDYSKNNVREYSNGESAYNYFTEKLDNPGLYLLDEPENSLSPKHQIELANLIEECARFFDYQFIIATHSPIFLALRGAKIYDLDETPVFVKRWTELESTQAYYNFFMLHRNEF